MISLLLINLLVSASLVYGFWDVVDHINLIIWMSLMLSVLLIRAKFYFSYKNSFDPRHLRRFSFFLVAGSASAGIIWGLGGILLFPADHLNYQLFLLQSIMAMVVGSTFTLSVYLPAYFAYAPLALAPITVYLFMLGGSIHNSLGFATIVFLAAITLFNLKINKSFISSLLIRYENNDLIEQLHIQRTEADNANLAKSKFLAAASHDLRQPLYSLSLFTSVLDEMTDDPKVQKVVGQINASVDSLKSLFDALLDISQLDAGVMNVEKSSFNLQGIFNKLKNDFNPQVAEKGLVINWPNDTYAVMSEPRLLEQILRNYLTNALRYTQQGSISVDCELNENEITIQVIDTGIGIESNEHEHIFSEFYQLSNSERDRQKGLGLGLSIVQRSADLLGHCISLKSTLGEGSNFSVTLELAENHAEISLQPNVQIMQPKNSESLENALLIVVIDDEKSIRDGLRQLLEIWQYDVVTASSGQTAVQKLQQKNKAPDAIISDFRLRDNETGINVIDTIHQAYHADIPALIVTGDIEKNRLIEMNSRNFDVLYKPVPPLKLRAFLNQLEDA